MDIYELGFLSYINRNISDILDYNILDIAKEINLLKIQFELFLYCMCKLKYSYKDSKKYSREIIKNNIDMIYEYEDIDDFFGNDTIINDKEFFLLLINKLQA